MKKTWNNRWKKALIWLCGYINFIAYAVVGGYVIAKSEDEELRKTAKTAFIVTLIFTAIGALQTLLSSINSLSGYNANFAEGLSWFSFIVTIAKIAVYAAFIIASLFGASAENAEKPASADDAKQESDAVKKDEKSGEDKE